MTDVEIIKAFESCYLYDVMFCDKCSNKDTCGEIDVAERTLDLINRQQAEIERLESKVNRLKQYDEERDIRLHARLIATAKSEAVKEFAERLKEKAKMPLGTLYGEMLYIEDIDNLLKEMGCKTDA